MGYCDRSVGAVLFVKLVVQNIQIKNEVRHLHCSTRICHKTWSVEFSLSPTLLDSHLLQKTDLSCLICVPDNFNWQTVISGTKLTNYSPYKWGSTYQYDFISNVNLYVNTRYNTYLFDWYVQRIWPFLRVLVSLIEPDLTKDSRTERVKYL